MEWCLVREVLSPQRQFEARQDVRWRARQFGDAVTTGEFKDMWTSCFTEVRSRLSRAIWMFVCWTT